MLDISEPLTRLRRDLVKVNCFIDIPGNFALVWVMISTKSTRDLPHLFDQAKILTVIERATTSSYIDIEVCTKRTEILDLRSHDSSH